jgi:hypothetical protein
MKEKTRARINIPSQHCDNIVRKPALSQKQNQRYFSNTLEYFRRTWADAKLAILVEPICGLNRTGKGIWAPLINHSRCAANLRRPIENTARAPSGGIRPRVPVRSALAAAGAAPPKRLRQESHRIQRFTKGEGVQWAQSFEI